MARLATSYQDFTKIHFDQRHQMINEVYDVMVGDRIALWNFTTEREELLEVSEKMYLSGLIECYPLGKRDPVVLNPKDHTIFKIPKAVKFFGDHCQCGAKHTSFQNHHLFYCPLYKRQDR